MQDGLKDLLHLGDFPFSGDTPPEYHSRVKDQRMLSDKDKVSLKGLAPNEIQQWCLSTIAEHQDHIHVLREVYGAAARDAILTTKSHIRALRAVYNDTAPINRHLLPELLMQIFSHVHPAVMPRPLACIPVLRICRYWRSLLFRTPQFWANLLSLRSWTLWNRKHHLGRFRAALVRSGSTTLSLSVPHCEEVIADILTSEASRIASLKVGPTAQCIDDIAQVLEQAMPRLTHLAILQSTWHHSESTLNLDFSRHTNIRVLKLERTYIFTPVSPYTSLSHLKLRYCAPRPPPTTPNAIRSLCAVHDALAFFPNLETLSIVHSLADDDWHGRTGPPTPAPEKTIHLPRLRRLQLTDVPAYIPVFLAHLVFPATTALALEPAVSHHFAAGPPAVPLFPGISGQPPPALDASLSLRLDFTNPYASRALWETHSGRSVRVALAGAADRALLVASFSRELAAALGALTTLSAAGSSGTRAYWACVLPALPRVRSLAYAAGRRDTEEVLALLASGTLCPELVSLALVWHVPPRVEVGDPAVWRPLQDGEARMSAVGAEGTEQDSLVGSLERFCDALKASLMERGHVHGQVGGTCEGPERIRELVVAPCQWRLDGTLAVFEEWQMALGERRLRERLGDLVESVAVVKDF